jgi:hypothetical protein
VNAAGAARPLALVFAVVVFVPVSANVPLAPVAGAVNITTMPPAGNPFVVTVAVRGWPKAPLTSWLWGVPFIAATDMIGGKLTTLGRFELQLTSPSRQAAIIKVRQAWFIALHRLVQFSW